jgi:phosphoribosylglycinamide formyltransferase 1
VKRIAALISGEGRNLQAILDACADVRTPARVVSVISNRASAPGLQRAERAGVPTRILEHGAYPSREAYDQALVQALDASAPDILVLAGFMRILTPVFTRRYHGRALNIHPSLLPRHPGLNTHQRVLDSGEAEHGATVHFVTDALDGGPRVIQGAFTVGAQDDAQTLAERVMHEIELKIFPQAIAWMARDELTLDTALNLRFRGRLLDAPLGLADLTPEFR